MPTPPAHPKNYHIVHADRLPSILAEGKLWCDAVIARRASSGTVIGMGADPASFIRAVGKAMAMEMEATDWTLGCAAQNLAIELAPGDREFADALAKTFAGWTLVITDAIRPAYPSRAMAERRATAILAALEGAKTLARTARSATPFDAVIDMVLPELRAAKAGR